MYPLPDFIKRLEMVESSGNPNAISMRNDQPIAYGARQITPTTGRAIAERMGRNDLLALDDAAFRKALLDPTTNRALSDYHINELSKRYGGDQRLMAIAYNAGQGRADAYRNTGNFAALPAETQGYVRKLGLLGSGDEMAGGGGSGILAGGGADPMLGGSAASGSPFEGASERDKWVAWGQALSQAFRGRDNSEAMGRLSALENQGVEQNKTYQALIKRGLDPATAEWAVRDPVVMREMVQQLFAPKARNMQIGEIFDPATGRPVKVLIDQTTGEYQPIGGVAAPDPAKAPHLQATEIYDEKTGGKRKVLLNPQTGEQTPIGGVAAADAPKETALDKQVAKERVDLASGAIQSAASARGMLPILDHLKQISDGDQGDLSRAIGGLQGYDWFQSSVGQIGGWGSPGLNAQIKNLSAQLNADLGRVWLAGQGSASDSERQMVRDAIGNLPFARNKDEFDNLLGQIETRINRKIAEGAQASKSVPNLDVTGGAAPKLRKITASELTEAQAAINAGVDRNKVIQRLRQHGINPAGL